jgi:hypothetical protein
MRYIQTEPFATDDLDPYRESWVALRKGKVIASAPDLDELSAHDGVRRGDLFLFVPADRAETLIL